MPRLSPNAPRVVRARRGFTLIELMITVVLFSIVMGALMTVIARQQRFYRGANEMIDGRSQMRQAATLLPMDLRGLSSSGGDLKFVSDTMVRFNANFGSTIICSISGATLVAPPIDISRQTLTSWLFMPQRGDTAFLYDEGTLAGSEDDQWRRNPVDSVTMQTSGCGTYLTAAENSSSINRYKVWLRNSISSSVKTGAVVRFSRPVQYRFYLGGDGKYYLGFQQYTGSAWDGTPQPLAGPYRNYASTGTGSGMKFTYYDTSGTALTDTTATGRAKVARIDISVKTAGTQVNNRALARGGQFLDSLLVRVAIRNRN